MKRLTRLLCDRIETIDPGFGIEVMTLAATIAEPLVRQADRHRRWSRRRRPTSPILSISSPTASASARVYRAAPVASDVPERSVCRVAPLAPETGASWPGHWPRPARLLRQPEPIETVALLPDHPPVSFTWRGVRRRVRRADGPERVFGEWWKRDAELVAVRDYFRVEDEAGERYWIYPRRRRRGRRDRLASLVPARGVRMSDVRAMPSCRSPRISPSCAARPPAEELFAQAAVLGIEALAVVDRN